VKLYVSGPMTGLPEFNYPAFHEAKRHLEEAGFDVISPADLPIRDDWEWIDYILADIDSVFACDGIATLNGCEQSKGARIECRIAEQRGIPVRPLRTWLNGTAP
jgi:hypothetical protein